MKNADYTDLFKQIATRHVLLAHTEGTPAFARIVNSTQPVPYLFTDEFTGLCNSLKTPFLVLETYDNSYLENNASGRFKIYNGAFLILTQADTGDQNAIDTALDTCEGIAEDILALLKGYFRNYTPYKGYSFDFNNQNMEKIGPVAQGFWGVRFNLMFMKEYNPETQYSSGKWLASGTSGRPQDILTLFAG